MKIFTEYQIMVAQEAFWAAVLAAGAFAVTYFSNAEGVLDWRAWAIAGFAGAGRVALVAAMKALSKVLKSSETS